MNKKEKPDFTNLRPNGSYLDDLTGFANLIGSMDEAEAAAEKLLRETDKIQRNWKESEKNTIASEKTLDKEMPEKPDVNMLLAELDSLVGLKKIKENVRSLINLVKVRKLRQENDLPIPSMSLHLVFMGNPGTGKTTVARLIAKLYYAIGVLSKGQLVEVDRAGLVAGFVGQTAMKTGEVIKSALGGVLFIDEAYSLVPSGDGGNDFGREAIETLLKAMEDNRDDLVVIVAGYENLMEQFILSNPGLESRFNRYFLFEDYSESELYSIFVSMCEKNGYTLENTAEEFAKLYFTQMYENRDENFGNARDVRNLFENIISVQADRVSGIEEPVKTDLMTIIREDIEKAGLL